jgi:hypothetical protein
VHLVTTIGGHDPYAVRYHWPLCLTLDVSYEIQLRMALQSLDVMD